MKNWSPRLNYSELCHRGTKQPVYFAVLGVISTPFICTYEVIQQYHFFFKSLPLSGLIQQMTNWWHFSYFSPENRIWHFMQIISSGDNLHKISKPVFWRKIRKIFPTVICWNFYPALTTARGPRWHCITHLKNQTSFESITFRVRRSSK